MSPRKWMLVLIACICGSASMLTFVHASAAVTNTVGNLSGHLRQGGEVASQGDWIYYRNDGDNGRLYRKKADGTGKKKLSNDSVSQLNVVGDWIYYTSDARQDEGKKYRLNVTTNQLQPLSQKPDPNLTRLSQALENGNSLSRLDELAKHRKLLAIVNDSAIRQILVSGNQLFYEKGNFVYKYDLSNDRETQLTFGDHPAVDLYLHGSYVYYNFSSKIERVPMSGGQPEDVGTNMNQVIGITDDYIYYIYYYDGLIERKKLGSPADEEGEKLFDFSADDHVQALWTEDAIYAAESDTDYLYRLDLKNASVTRLNEDSTKTMILSGKSIYYSNCSDGAKLYKVGLDGTGRQKLTEIEADNFRLSGDWLYFTNESDMKMIYKVKTDGSGRKRISNRSAETLMAVGNTLYFQDENRKRETFRIDPNGTISKPIVSNDTNKEYEYDQNAGTVYYSYNGKDLRSVRTDGTQDRSLFDPLFARFPVTVDGWIYYVNPEQDDELFRKKAGSDDAERLMPHVPVWKFAITDNRIYYLDYGNKLHVFDMSTKHTSTVIDATVMDFAIDQGTLYYIEQKTVRAINLGMISLSNNSGLLKSVNLSGGASRTLSDEEYDAIAGVKDGFVIASLEIFQQSQTTSRIPAQGGAAQTIIRDGACGPYNCRIDGDWIYYENADYHLSKTRIDGTGSSVIISDSVSAFDIWNGKIYYGDDDRSTFNRAELDGSQQAVLEDAVEVAEVQSLDGQILFSTVNEGALLTGIHAYSPADGKFSEPYIEAGIREVTATNKALYWIQDSDLMTSSLDGSKQRVAIAGFAYQNYVISNNWIVYDDPSDNTLYKVHLDGSGKSKIVSNDPYLESWYVFGDWVYYYDYDGWSQLNLLRIKLNGTKKEMFG